MPDKHAVLRDHAAALREIEVWIETQLQEDVGMFRDYPEVHALLSAAIKGAGQRLATLTEYLGGAQRGSDHHKGATFVHDTTPAPATVLNRHIAEFGNAVTAYTVLTELAFRFYDLPLRELAPKHLKAYVSLSYAALRLLPGVVAQAWAMQGLFCQCVCPMCGLGACACITVGRQHVETAWRDAVGSRRQQKASYCMRRAQAVHCRWPASKAATC
jgi:hypothetical protein